MERRKQRGMQTLPKITALALVFLPPSSKFSVSNWSRYNLVVSFCSNFFLFVFPVLPLASVVSIAVSASDVH